MRATLGAIDRDAFWTDYMHRNWGDYINDASEDDLAELPFMPRDLHDRAVDEVLRRIKNSVR